MLTKIHHPLYKKGQISVYLFAIMATMITLAYAVINVGKTVKDVTYADNAADGGALAACSIMSQGMNYMADGNSKKDSKLQQRTDSDYGPPTQGRQTGQFTSPSPVPPNNPSAGSHPYNLADIQRQRTGSQDNLATWYAPDNANHTQNVSLSTRGGNAGDEVAGEQQRQQTDQADNASSDSRNFGSDPGGGEGGEDSYYDNALKMGYMYNFMNSGTQHRLGRINRHRWSQFLKEIQENPPQNGEPKTFFWVDGAGRVHTVTAIIEIEPVNNWDTTTSENPQSQVQEDYRRGEGEYRAGTGHDARGLGQNGVAGAAPWTAWDAGWSGAAKGSAGAGLGQDLSGFSSQTQGQAGGQSDNNQVTGSISQTANEYYMKNLNDIVHSQTVYSANFQFHMGSPVKGMRGDVDPDPGNTPIYPPVQGSAMASFNHTGQGKVYNEGSDDGADQNYECGLMMAF
jgi:hypothetical protein